MLALDKQIDLVKEVPNAKRVGMVYNPGEANSVVVVKQRKAAAHAGMTWSRPRPRAAGRGAAPHAA